MDNHISHFILVSNQCWDKKEFLSIPIHLTPNPYHCLTGKILDLKFQLLF